MKLGITQLNFVLPENPFGEFPGKLDSLTEKIKSLEKKAGTENEKFKKAYLNICSALQKNQDLASALDKPIKVRALAILLQSEYRDHINLTENVLRKVNQLRPKPSSLLIQNIYQHYLLCYDKLSAPQAVSSWLRGAMEYKGLLQEHHKNLLGQNGPQWLAKQCISQKREFLNQLQHFDLQNYRSGRFLTVAKNIYYVEQLKSIPVNKPHHLLEELQNKSAFNSRYNEKYLLGHKVLEILIQRAPIDSIHESWLNIIIAIAGDPRVPKTHPNYLKWWSAFPQTTQSKVKGWLSRLDLRLFLEALRDYSFQSGKNDLQRMFPSRKTFLEGLLDRGLITNTRLYLTTAAERYLKQNYKKEHLPYYSMVTDGGRSLIHVELGKSHLIEGSHSCYLWIYKYLHPSAIVFDTSITSVTYRDLTQGLSDVMSSKGTPSRANITHNPVGFSWQQKAIKVLNEIGVRINPSDVLSSSDYRDYLIRYGRY